VDEAEAVGESGNKKHAVLEVDFDWTTVPWVAEPDETSYYQALRSRPPAHPDVERPLRTLAWWRHNDRLRFGGKKKSLRPHMHDDCRSNLLALADVMD
jgi:hypothetical protein